MSKFVKPTGKRQALVIGNSNYEKAGALVSPKNDAQSMAHALMELDFDVELGLDLDVTEMSAIFAKFEQGLKAAKPDTVLLYYSGHGVQADGVNFLVPLDAEAASSNAFAELVPVQEWIERISVQTQRRLIFLDACRENPFAPSIIEGAKGAKGFVVGEREVPVKPPAGLAEIKAESNTFIAFAAAPGEVAYDGKGRHSPFTEGILKYIEATDLSLGNLMIRVRNEVLAATDDRQKTWDHSSLTATFFFNPGSLIWLVGNSIGLFALMFSLTPYSFALAGSLDRTWVSIALSITVLTFALFIYGLQRAYQMLRGKQATRGFKGNDPPQKGFAISWQQGLFGGFFGGIIAGPIITAAYAYAWPAKLLSTRPPLGQLLTEITIAAVIVSLVLGVAGLACASYFAQLGRQRSASGNSGQSWVFNVLIGGIVGGIIAGLITAPLETVYFGLKDRPFLSPTILLMGALPGTLVIAFSIVNYALESMSRRKLLRSAIATAGATITVAAVSAVVLYVFQTRIKQLIENRISNDTIPDLLIGGVFYGILVGTILGAVIGLTLKWTGDGERSLEE